MNIEHAQKTALLGSARILRLVLIETKIVELQKTVILNSARILRKVLEF